MKKKVLVLGSTGLIGHQVHNYLKNSGDYDLVNIAFRNKLQKDTILADARNETEFVGCIEKIRPEYIINCIGVLISHSRNFPEDAIFLNAYLPHMIEQLANSLNAKLIHMSTDCVFSGSKKKPYIESDEKDGLDNYSKTKNEGEIINNKHLTIRTSVVGPELKPNGNELFNWFMNQDQNISGYTRAIWSGVTTLELAKAVKWSIENDITGLYHLTNNQSISKNNLLNLFKKYTQKEININPISGPKVDKSFVDTRKLINYKIPSYEQMIIDMIEFISNNSSFYPHYKIRNPVEK